MSISPAHIITKTIFFSLSNSNILSKVFLNQCQFSLLSIFIFDNNISTVIFFLSSSESLDSYISGIINISVYQKHCQKSSNNSIVLEYW